MNDNKPKDNHMDDNKDQLLGCPLCGSVPSIVKGDNEDGSPWMVICSSCDCYTVGFESKEEAIRKWNEMERNGSKTDSGNTCMTGYFRKIAEHYNHAREKHPGFVDMLFTNDNLHCAGEHLEYCREFLKECEDNKRVSSEAVVNCELAEAVYAIAGKDDKQAVEELYDTIAVLLRIVDVIEGRQKIG